LTFEPLAGAGPLYTWTRDGSVTSFDPNTLAVEQSLVVGPQNCCSTISATLGFGNDSIYELVPQGSELLRFDTGGQLLASGNDPSGAFGITVVTSDIPEPGTMVLLAPALLVLVRGRPAVRR